MHVVNFLDAVIFDLNNGKFKPYRKPNDDPLYINRHSNHPPSIIKQLPTSINKRISVLSADEQTFHESAPIYQNALRHSNFDHKLDYMKQAPQKTRRNVKTNIARNFLCLVDKHFPPNHKLHKIFNRNTVKVCYSCMNNVKSIISKHNTRITRKSKPQCEVIDPCTCRDKKTCPLQEKCMTKDVVYKATFTTSNTNSTKHYIGMTASTFKERYIETTLNLSTTKGTQMTQNFRNIFGN